MFYVIQGIFFTEKYQAQGVSYPFNGHFEISNEGLEEGQLCDYFGDSDMSEIMMTETQFDFFKTYFNGYGKGGGQIHYSFTKKDGIWIGKWCAQHGRGFSNCVAQAVDKDVFKIPHPELFD